MKNLKKCFILGIVILSLVVYCVYYITKNNEYEEIDDNDIYIEQEEIKEIENIGVIVLHITGEVQNPGVIELQEGSRIVDAIEAAGGTTENADISKINLAYMLEDGQKIYIPSYNDQKTENFISSSSGENIIQDNASIKNKININTASKEELETINGIGSATAEKIINYRKENGKFKTIEEIKKVPGIGDAKFNAIKEFIKV